jgi:hypothetical protein
MFWIDDYFAQQLNTTLDCRGKKEDILRTQKEEKTMLEGYGMADVDPDALPRGVIVGTVELYDCDGGNWHVRNPERAKTLRKPKNHPQPVWFNPF